MAFTQADLDAIRSAIAKGERMVTFSDRSVSYRSMDELFLAEERIAGALATAASPGRQKQSFGVSTKGF